MCPRAPPLNFPCTRNVVNRAWFHLRLSERRTFLLALTALIACEISHKGGSICAWNGCAKQSGEWGWRDIPLIRIRGPPPVSYASPTVEAECQFISYGHP